MEKVVYVTFSASYTPGIDKMYGYLIDPEAQIEPEQILWVDTYEGLKKVKVLKITTDAKVINTLKSRYNMQYAYVEKPEVKPTEGKKRL